MERNAIHERGNLEVMNNFDDKSMNYQTGV
jgi:hypothetical protein